MCRFNYQIYSFKSFHYAINLNVLLSFMVFSDFDYMFFIDVLLVKINKIIFLLKKIKFIIIEF